MKNQKQRSPHKKLELINRQKPETESNSAKLYKLVQTVWQNVSDFMTYKSEHTQQSHEVWWNTYGWKQRTYAYLPAIEEERDWLEKVYHQPNR